MPIIVAEANDMNQSFKDEYAKMLLKRGKTSQGLIQPALLKKSFIKPSWSLYKGLEDFQQNKLEINASVSSLCMYT